MLLPLTDEYFKDKRLRWVIVGTSSAPYQTTCLEHQIDLREEFTYFVQLPIMKGNEKVSKRASVHPGSSVWKSEVRVIVMSIVDEPEAKAHQLILLESQYNIFVDEIKFMTARAPTDVSIVAFSQDFKGIFFMHDDFIRTDYI